jgi:ketosteroid isomerase-like protein
MMDAQEANSGEPERNMTEDLNRQRVLNFLEVFYSGNIEGALARCSDDVEFFSSAPVDILPHMGAHRGKDELRAMWQTIRQRYEQMRYETPTVLAEGDKVAALIRVFFRKRQSARMVQFDLAAFYTLRNGRIAEIREVMDTFDLVEQVLERDLSAVLTGKPFDKT